MASFNNSDSRKLVSSKIFQEFVEEVSIQKNISKQMLEFYLINAIREKDIGFIKMIYGTPETREIMMFDEVCYGFIITNCVNYDEDFLLEISKEIIANDSEINFHGWNSFLKFAINNNLRKISGYIFKLMALKSELSVHVEDNPDIFRKYLQKCCSERELENALPDVKSSAILRELLKAVVYNNLPKNIGEKIAEKIIGDKDIPKKEYSKYSKYLNIVMHSSKKGKWQEKLVIYFLGKINIFNECPEILPKLKTKYPSQYFKIVKGRIENMHKLVNPTNLKNDQISELRNIVNFHFSTFPFPLIKDVQPIFDIFEITGNPTENIYRLSGEQISKIHEILFVISNKSELSFEIISKFFAKIITDCYSDHIFDVIIENYEKMDEKMFFEIIDHLIKTDAMPEHFILKKTFDFFNSDAPILGKNGNNNYELGDYLNVIVRYKNCLSFEYAFPPLEKLECGIPPNYLEFAFQTVIMVSPYPFIEDMWDIVIPNCLFVLEKSDNFRDNFRNLLQTLISMGYGEENCRNYEKVKKAIYLAIELAKSN